MNTVSKPRGNQAFGYVLVLWIGLLVTFLILSEISKLHLLWLFPSAFVIVQVVYFLVLKAGGEPSVEEMSESFVVELEREFGASADMRGSIVATMRKVIRGHHPDTPADVLGRLDSLVDGAYDPSHNRFNLVFLLFNLNSISFSLEHGRNRPGFQNDVANLTFLSAVKNYVKKARKAHSIVDQFSLSDPTYLAGMPPPK